MTRWTSHLLTAVVAGAVGIAAGAWWSAGAPVVPTPSPVPAPVAAVSSPIAASAAPPASDAPASPAPADDQATLLRANELGCDCPLPPPDDVDPRYLEPGVEAWLDELERSCPEFASRKLQVDCSEWPCMIVVESKDDREWLRPDLTAALTCGDPNALELVSRGQLGGVDALRHLFSVRPTALREYGQREFVRMTQMTVDF